MPYLFSFEALLLLHPPQNKPVILWGNILLIIQQIEIFHMLKTKIFFTWLLLVLYIFFKDIRPIRFFPNLLK